MIPMRQQFVATITELMHDDPTIVLLLGDIGVFGFRNAFAAHPTRTYNIGILEQSTVSVAAGLASTGLIPIVHTIAPFLVERSFEQLKIDFGYQRMNGNFVSVGASYDYAGLGCTHHCPGDVGVLRNIPGMSIIVPGTSKEFDQLFRQTYNSDGPRYFRMSEVSNSIDIDVEIGKAAIVRHGSDAVVVVVGPMLEPVLAATTDMDVTVLYYTTIAPFDADTLRSAFLPGKKIILCEPYYEGGLTWEITRALAGQPVCVEYIGVPHEFLRHYGTKEEHDTALGLDKHGVKEKIDGYLK